MKKIVILILLALTVSCVAQKYVIHDDSYVVQDGEYKQQDPAEEPETNPWDGTVYYVATTGSDSDPGSYSEPWATVTHAMSATSPVEPGDSVYVKAGNYGTETINIYASGTDEDRIVVQGYKNTPGDQPYNEWTYGDVMNADSMPYYDHNNTASGTGLYFRAGAEFVTVNNLQIREYANAVIMRAGNNIIENIFCDDNGSGIALQGNKLPLTLPPDWTYQIRGYDSDSSKVINCTVINAYHEAIRTFSDYDTIIGCEVYSDLVANPEAGDYYIVLTGQRSHVEDCYVHRVGELDHRGHGIGVKGSWIQQTEYNTFYNNTCRNIDGEAFWVGHQSVKYTTFDACSTINCGGNFHARDGASYNTWKNCVVDSATAYEIPGEYRTGAISMVDYTEPGTGSEDGPCTNNRWENCIIKNSHCGIGLNFATYDSASRANVITNCVFYNLDYFMNITGDNANDTVVNCIVMDVDDDYYYSTKTDNVIYMYTDFYSNGFTAFSGTGNETFDPEMTDPANGDFTLQTGSNSIDEGIDMGLPFLGAAPDLGAFEKE